MKILAFAASNHSNSINKQLVSYISSKFEGHDVEVLDINDYEMPIYSIDREVSGGVPKLAEDFAAKIDGVDLLIISLAEYNGSYSTAFKNPSGAYVSGRFYTCTNHKYFSAKVAKFFTKLKKVFIYLKPQKLYISKNIDLDSALFLLSNRVVKLSIDGTEEVIQDVKKTSKKAPSVKVIPDKMNLFDKK